MVAGICYFIEADGKVKASKTEVSGYPHLTWSSTAPPSSVNLLWFLNIGATHAFLSSLLRLIISIRVLGRVGQRNPLLFAQSLYIDGNQASTSDQLAYAFHKIAFLMCVSSCRLLG